MGGTDEVRDSSGRRYWWIGLASGARDRRDICRRDRRARDEHRHRGLMDDQETREGDGMNAVRPPVGAPATPRSPGGPRGAPDVEERRTRRGLSKAWTCRGEVAPSATDPFAPPPTRPS